MEKYVITLEQAKRLYELGFKAPYDWGWANEAEDGPGRVDKWYVTNYDPAFIYPAYHVGELGEMLGVDIYLAGGEVGRGWSHAYSAEKYPTEAQARGALLQYLLENGLI